MLFVLDHTSPEARYFRSLFTIVTRCEFVSGFSQQIFLMNRIPFLLLSSIDDRLVLDSLSICLYTWCVIQFSRYILPFLQGLVDLGGLEPPTSRLSGVRSNLLSYRSLNS